MIISAVDAFNDPDSPKAQAARECFAIHGPADLQPLPLGYSERESCQSRSGAHHILKWYARSLASNHYDVHNHRPFDDFARGVMASEFAPDFTKNDEQLQSAFHRAHWRGLARASCGSRPSGGVADRVVRLMQGAARQLAEEHNMPSFFARLRDAEAQLAKPVDPWLVRLERVRGKIGDDGIERISTQTLFDYLEVFQRSRGAGACRRLANVMRDLGWTPVRVRDLTRGGYKEQVRGYCRIPPN